MKRAVLVKTWGCYPSFRLSLTLLREGFVQICREFTEILTDAVLKTLGCYPCTDCLEKLTLLRDFVQIRREFTEIMTIDQARNVRLEIKDKFAQRRERNSRP